MTPSNWPDQGAVRPAARASERSLVGVLLIWPSQLPEVAGLVTLEDFTDTLSRSVFEAMLTLHARGIVPTVPTISDEMHQSGRFQQLGVDASVLVSIEAESPSSRKVDGLCRVIIEESTRRRLALIGKTVHALASDRSIDVGEALDQAKQMVGDVDLPGNVASEVEPLGAFCAGEDDFDWLVPSVMERGDRTLIVAPESAGKSMLMRQIAVTCSFGIHPFNGRAVDPMRVLMVDLENPPSMARRKIRPMLAKARQVRPQGDDTMMGVVCRPAGIDVTRRADALWLAGQIADARPDLVLCGPLYKMFHPDERYETGAKTVTAVLDDLRTRHGFALVMETHAPQEYGGKREMRPIGSSLWRRWTDFGLSFEPIVKGDDSKTIVKVRVWKPRDERQWPRFMRRGGDWPWTPCGDPGAPGEDIYHNQPAEEPF
jgi:hypothetical protein